MSKPVIAIIPAKANSRRVPKKNMRPFNGQPLVYYTIQRALESHELDEVYVSTDSQEIQEYAKHLGVRVPFLRQPEHSGDEVHAVVPVLDMLERLGGATVYSYCVLLSPTFPLRKTQTIDAVVRLAKSRNRNVLSVTPTGKIAPHFRVLNAENILQPVTAEMVYNFQTQDAPQVVYINGSTYCAPASELLWQRTFQYGMPLGYVMNPIEAVDIDTNLDFLIAERLADLAAGDVSSGAATELPHLRSAGSSGV